MTLSMPIFALLVPLLFWAAYHYYHDRHRPEPLLNLLLCLLLGAAASYVNRYMYLGLDILGLRYDATALAINNLPGLFAYAVLVIGVTEELAKMLPFLIVVLRFEAFDEPIDGIIYGSFIALGFAFLENLHYLNFLTQTEALARGFAGPIVHIVFASLWAYPVGKAHVDGQKIAIQAVVWLAISAFIHGIYDFIVLGFPTGALLVAAVVILALWIWRLKLILQLQAEAPPSEEPAV